MGVFNLKDSNSQILVILLSVSLIIGCFIPGFLENNNIITAVTLSALSFVFIDVANFLKLHKIYSIIFLFLAIFSITIIPNVESLYSFLSQFNNFFTVYGLALVIGILGVKQYTEEKIFLSKTKKNLKQRDIEFEELIQLLEEKNEEIEYLKKELLKIKKRNI